MSILKALAFGLVIVVSTCSVALAQRGSTVSVLFATTRNLVTEGPRVGLGNSRGTLSLGHAVVRPASSLWSIVGSPVQALSLLTSAQFGDLAREKLAEPQVVKQALIFVHGVNTTFDQALTRAADLMDAVQFKGVICAFSWPSSGNLTGYLSDAGNADSSEPHLRELLALLLERAGAEKVSLVAHGMGARPLLQVLAGLASNLPRGKRLEEVILVAPDVDRDVFSVLAQRIRPHVGRITLYASPDDAALMASRQIVGAAPRAGDVTVSGPVVVAGVDTVVFVGAEKVTPLSGHHYFYYGPGSVVSDIGRLLRGGASPPDRRAPELERVATPQGDYWRFPSSPGAPDDDGHYAAIPVFFGTDREQDSKATKHSFSGRRGYKLTFGRALVTVPKAHEIAAGPERPAWRDIFWGRNPWKEDPKRHFTIFELSLLDRGPFSEAARERLSQARVFAGHAVVFVHGYNVSFENALYRTAQVGYDLGFDGVLFLYSWPSGGGLSDYLYDRDSADLSVKYLLDFLREVLSNSGAASVHLVAHSLGNDPMLKALSQLATEIPKTINQIVLAAPDIDKDRFTELAARITRVGQNRTLYASSTDAALVAARRLAKGIARAGDVPAGGPLIIPGIDSIDASAISTGVFSTNHSGYAESRELLGDMRVLLHKGVRPPKERTSILQVVPVADGFYWRFPR